MTTPDSIHDPRRPRPAPIEFAGQWVAWNRQRCEIIAHGKTFAEAHDAAAAAGHPNAIFQKVRRPDANFIGAT
jgi:hypothetical protein